MKIGVLVPQSKVYSTLGKDFVNGLKMIGDFSVIIEGIGFGNDHKLIADKMDRLSMQEDVDCIVGLVGDNELTELYEKANSLEVPSIFARLGAFPDVETPDNKFAFSISLDTCNSLAFVGPWFHSKGWSKIGVSGSFNDVGYGFLKSLEDSIYTNGGEFSGHYTPPLEPRPNEAECLKSFYDTIESDVVCQLYNGIYATENIEFLTATDQKIASRAVFTPFGLNESLLEGAFNVFEETYIVGSWIAPELRQDRTTFDKAFEEKFDKPATASALLGYEVGLSLKDVVNGRKNILQGEEVILESPRGQLRWNENLRLEAPVHVWKAQKKEEKVSMFFESTLELEDTTKLTFSGQEQGWHNAYLCY